MNKLRIYVRWILVNFYNFARCIQMRNRYTIIFSIAFISLTTIISLHYYLYKLFTFYAIMKCKSLHFIFLYIWLWKNPYSLSEIRDRRSRLYKTPLLNWYCKILCGFKIKIIKIYIVKYYVIFKCNEKNRENQIPVIGLRKFRAKNNV